MPPFLSARRAPIGTAVAFAVLETVMVPWLEEPVAAIAFAVLFMGAAVWIWRGGRAGLIALAALCALELAFVPFYPRVAFEDWIFQGTTVVLSVVGLVTSSVALRRHSGAHAPA